MKSSLSPGVTGEYRHRIVTENLVSFRKPGAPAVMSTPWVLYAMETAAYEAIRPHLDPGEASVGVGFQFCHHHDGAVARFGVGLQLSNDARS